MHADHCIDEMAAMIEAKDLRKVYGGKVVALAGISFTVNEGEIFALIGPNGAGKTTTLRILATLLTPTGGYARVGGYDVVKEANRVRRIISYLPEEAGAYERLTGREFLKFFADLMASSPSDVPEMVERGVEIAGLGERIDNRIKEYSKGMKRRLLLARALMSIPKVALLDEPTSGLDVYHAVHVRKTIKSFCSRHKVTVLVSSHNMLEIEFLSDRVGFINQGRLLAVGSPKELIGRFGGENLEEAFVRAVESHEEA